MNTIVQLGDYDSVVANKDRLQAVSSLPQDDPSYMPVTRDLSPAKRQMILNWLVTTGNSGQPNLGTPPAAPPHAAVLAAEPPGGKTAAVQRAGPSRSQRPPFVNEPL